MHRSNASGLVQRRTEATIAAAAANLKSKSDEENGDIDERYYIYNKSDFKRLNVIHNPFVPIDAIWQHFLLLIDILVWYKRSNNKPLWVKNNFWVGLFGSAFIIVMSLFHKD